MILKSLSDFGKKAGLLEPFLRMLYISINDKTNNSPKIEI